MSIRTVSPDTLKRTILRVLRSSAAQTINFSYRTQWNDEVMRGARVTFHGYSLERVARAIERGQIRVGFLTPREALREGGEYDTFENLLRISAETWHSPYRDAVIVHEAVHAAEDMGFLLMTTFDAELMAYIVETIYRVRTQGYITAYPGGLEVLSMAAARTGEISDADVTRLSDRIDTYMRNAGFKERIRCGSDWCYTTHDFDGVGRRRRR